MQHRHFLSFCVSLIVGLITLAAPYQAPRDFTFSPESEADWQAYMQFHTPEASHKQFKFLHAGETFTAHTPAHMFGHALFDVFGDAAMHICDDDFNGGCLHGYIGNMLTTYGIQHFDNVISQCKQAQTSTAPNECEHSAGHALVYVYGYTEEDLKKVLQTCHENFPETDTPQAGQCYHGAFMEFNQRNTGHSDEQTARPFDASRPYAPCDELEEQYKDACYYRLTRLWVVGSAEEDDITLYQKLGSWCRDIPDPAYQASCQSGVQTTITSYRGVNDLDYALELCSVAFPEPEAFDFCEQAITASFIVPKERIF